MADTNPFPRTVASITREGHGPQHHPCNDPSLGPLEFLHAVYCDPLLPMSIRIDAARGLLPYTEPRPANIPSLHIGCTIVIGSLGPCDPSPEPRSPADPTGFHSQNPFGANITVPRDGEPQAPQNLTTDPEASTFRPFSSTPGQSFIEHTLSRLSLDEIMRISADVPEHLLPTCTICNFPMMYPCSADPQPPSYTDPSTLPCVIRHTKGTVQ
jgi:hypothetical protein